MTEPKIDSIGDNRGLFKKLLGAALSVALLIAVPISKCADCDNLDSAPLSSRELVNNAENEIPNWASVSEGLRYVPFSVVKHLKRPKPDELKLYQERLFANPERFGMLPGPNDVPLGLVATKDAGYIDMAGLTCAACHVGAIKFSNEWYYVAGALSYMSVNIFFSDLIRSIAATLANPAEFDALWEKVAADEGFDVNDLGDVNLLSKDELENALKTQTLLTSNLTDAYPTVEAINSKGKLYAHLVVRLSQMISKAKGADDSASSPLGTSNPWATTRTLFGREFANLSSDKLKNVGGVITAPDIFGYQNRQNIFWAQATNSLLERNLAQGVALLGDVDWKTFETTLSPHGLQKIESEEISPPSWPSWLGEVDLSLAQQGCEIYKVKCSTCHDYDKTTMFAYRTYDVGTDPLYCEGVTSSVGDKFASIPDIVRPVASAVSVSALEREPYDQDGRFPVEWKTMQCNKLPARSLEGIWVTGPFLHNGSVRTIKQLLQPAGQREKTFRVGSHEFDQLEIGYLSLDNDITSIVDTTVPGLSNVGHEFVVGENERTSVLEYLKVHRDNESCEELVK